MAANTPSSPQRRGSRHASAFATGVLLVAACTSFPSHATLECTTDEEAVIKCEPTFLDPLHSRLRPLGSARCMENCAVCATLPEDFGNG